MTSPPVPGPEVTEAPAEPAQPVKLERCLNCGAILDGRFCAACGQEVRDPRPTTKELLHDIAGELFNWDGKLFSTLRFLVTRPGFLTKELLAGRRVRYLPPLRLYLICSVTFFALAALLPSRGLSVRYTGPASADSPRIRLQPREAREEKARADAAEACRRVAADTTSPSLLVRLSARAACRAQRGSSTYMPEVGTYYPKVGFALLPIYALILAPVYRHHRYPEHLYFALHVHAFGFLMLALSRLAAATSVRLLASWSGIAALLVIFAYSWLAQRRVYGGSALMTTGKTALIVVVYSFAFLMAVTVAALIALLN